MAFDGIFTYGMVHELNKELAGGRLTKIHQPFKQELIFQIRANNKNNKLLLSAHPSYARIHLTEQSYKNPNEPPMFCMLLRKHIEGGIIEKVEQSGFDRIVVFHIRSRNEIGDPILRKLVCEIMGRHSNIILTDAENGTIIDSLKHLPPSVNSYRTVLPGQPYVAPPAQNKLSLLAAEEEDILKHIRFQEGQLEKQIVNVFSGVSPLFAKEAVYRSGIANRATLPKTLLSLFEDIRTKAFHPQFITSNKEYFYLLDLTHIDGSKKEFSSLSMLLDRFYFGKAERDRVKQQAQDLEKFVVNERKKNAKKIKKLESELKKSEKAEEYKIKGELLTANLYAVKKGDKEAVVTNYYDEEGGQLAISLNPNKTPSENAQNYFVKYQKAKSSVTFINEQIKLAEQEIQYFDLLLQQLSSASPQDVNEIREELEEGKYVKRRQQKGAKKAKNQKPTLDIYESTSGMSIWVGKNNKQNEYLTMKAASKEDVWLHTKDIPGSHVVIKNRDPDEQTIKEAAQIAAFFSKAKESGSVPVDYTKVRHVKKPNGSKPGFVTYDKQQTVFVTPDADLVLSLKKG
ncbi:MULTISPECIES: Rqc2 family fibronectin-binding protein [Bacillus]|uniref:Rqc2 homolog RqcH n=2 Tax=Bacillus TaxID=1386 RepID=A0A0M4FSL8_9BACI|nr:MULTISPECIES: NFACT RNA binding domain-containing protein [Bacillus]ALC81005.1 hypothetical protein AM592_04920 [Bacillus gobiensis]MBP1079959.1 putative ribosome quality control (RQC) complex YloA/Tae2 family protein [Bacillus capparidis]MED1095346.1 NFACT RNA binding domain-containing protein [Bacillus capparidis]